MMRARGCLGPMPANCCAGPSEGCVCVRARLHLEGLMARLVAALLTAAKHNACQLQMFIWGLTPHQSLPQRVGGSRGCLGCRLQAPHPSAQPAAQGPAEAACPARCIAGSGHLSAGGALTVSRPANQAICAGRRCVTSHAGRWLSLPLTA